jgi:hypothetical protein
LTTFYIIIHPHNNHDPADPEFRSTASSGISSTCSH